jgi:MTH538 TIR-like domain (DUF1863)
MPELKTRTLFISHAWADDKNYEKIVEWLNAEPNFSWKNCSVTNYDSLPDKTSKGLSAGMTRQISPAQGVIILAGMYASQSAWIDYELSEAVRMDKIIIGVTPWGHERVPVNFKVSRRLWSAGTAPA